MDHYYQSTALTLSEPTEYVAKVKKKTLPERIPAFGIICSLLGVTMFSLASVIVKLLTELHAIEILIFRCIIQFIPYFILTMKNKYPIFGVPGHRTDLFLRCVTGTISLITLYMAYRLIPLSDASTIYLSSPVFVTVFAYFLLKEPITIIQVLTGALTMVGVVVISKPKFLFGSTSTDTDQMYNHRILGIILSLIGAISSACSLINLRKLKSTPVPVVVMWYSLSSVLMGIVVLPFLANWVIPTSLYTWSLLLGIGATGIINQFFQTTSLKYESAGPISVARSFIIVLSFIWDVVIFAEPVDWSSIVGACIISVCILIIAFAKCYNENPDEFRQTFRKLCCFCCKYTVEIQTISESDASDQNSTVYSIYQVN